MSVPLFAAGPVNAGCDSPGVLLYFAGFQLEGDTSLERRMPDPISVLDRGTTLRGNVDCIALPEAPQGLEWELSGMVLVVEHVFNQTVVRHFTGGEFIVRRQGVSGPPLLSATPDGPFSETYNLQTGSGSAMATIDFTGGTALDDLPVTEDWDFGCNVTYAGDPSGWYVAVNGSVHRPSPTRQALPSGTGASWGRVKSLYR